MLSSCTTSTIDCVFDWYRILKNRYNSLTLNYSRLVVIFHQVLEKKLFEHAIHVGAYWRGFRTPATSKTERFMAIADVFPKKTLKKSAKKKIIVVDKFSQINTTKLPHAFFFQSKTCYVNHVFFIGSSFFKKFVDGYWLCRLYTQLIVLTG